MRSLDKNPMTPEKVELGKLLFFDPILSGAEQHVLRPLPSPRSRLCRWPQAEHGL